jgi:hypothetical protein
MNLIALIAATTALPSKDNVGDQPNSFISNNLPTDFFRTENSDFIPIPKNY